MRIISQDGKHDFPYDIVSIEINDSNTIFAQSNIWGVDLNWIQIAKYSTEGKAKKAIEMLHEEYQFGKQFETICCGTTDYPSKPLYYFQFPTDEELED